MLEKEIVSYNSLLRTWEETNSQKLEKFLNVSNPIEFRYFFKELLIGVMDFDRLWNEMNSFAITNISGYISMTNNLKIILPEKFVIEKNKREVLIQKAMQENHDWKNSLNNRRSSGRNPQNANNSVEIEVPEYMELIFKDSQKVFKTFLKVCQNLENSLDKYPSLVTNFYDDAYIEIENSINALEKKIDLLPPPDLSDLYPDIQKYAESIMVYDINKNSSIIQDLPNYNNQMLNMLNQGNLLTNYNLNFRNKNNIFTMNMNNFPEVNNKLRSLEGKRKNIHDKIIRYGITSGNAPKLLKVLEEMNPEFPVFLPRLAELVTLEKQQTEDALNFLLAKSPELGKYDSMAQVLMFSKPTEVGKLIDSLLKKYEGSNIKL